MPRIRTIKPEFFTSKSVASLSYRARLTWQGIWTQADDEGRMRWDPRVLAGAIWPQEDEVTWADVAADVAELEAGGFVAVYAGLGGEFLAVSNWKLHQRIAKPTPSKFPTPPTPLPEDSGSPTAPLPEDVFHSEPVSNSFPEDYFPEGEGEREMEKEMEGEGEGNPPPRRCPEHLNVKNAPKCGPCKDARIDYEQWVTNHPAATIATVTGVQNDPDCQQHPGHPRIGCRRCSDEAAA